MLKNVIFGVSIFIIGVMFNCQAGEITFKTFRGNNSVPYSKDIWNVCLQVYKEYPYLWDASGTDYTYYIESFENSKDSVVVLAFDGKHVVGVATGLRFSDYTAEHYKAPFISCGYSLDSIFYVADLLILKEYRNDSNIAVMYKKLEAIAKKDPSYFYITYNEMEDDYIHQAPPDYKPLDKLLIKWGFVKQTETRFTTYYENINESEETPHTMVYWIKSLK